MRLCTRAKGNGYQELTNFAHVFCCYRLACPFANQTLNESAPRFLRRASEKPSFSIRPALNWDQANELIDSDHQQWVSPEFVADPLVTVSLVTFNHGKYVEQAIDGILQQETDFSFEILIGDDRSSDETLNILKDYQRSYPKKIRVIVSNSRLGAITKNGRLNFIRNLRMARGKYIALLEGDDYWTDKKKLKKQVQSIKSNPDAVGSFHLTQVLLESNPDSRRPRIMGSQAPDIVLVPDTFSRYSLWHTSSFMFLRSAIESIKLPEWFLSVFSLDMALFSMLSQVGPILKTDQVMSVYRKHDQGVTADLNIMKYHESRIDLAKKLLDFHGLSVEAAANQIIDFHSNQLKIENHPGLPRKMFRWLRAKFSTL